MAPFPPTCSVLLPMSAEAYLNERSTPAFRTLLSEVTSGWLDQRKLSPGKCLTFMMITASRLSDSHPKMECFWPAQVLDLGNTEVVASWDEGDVHFEEVSTQPDYGR